MISSEYDLARYIHSQTRPLNRMNPSDVPHYARQHIAPLLEAGLAIRSTVHGDLVLTEPAVHHLLHMRQTFGGKKGSS